MQQAEWTKPLRHHLYRKLEVARCENILEIGCGTGVIANELADRTSSAVYGLDNDRVVLAFARRQASNKGPIWVAGKAEKLPFGDESLDMVITHYLWLWVGHPDIVCNECQRVLKKGGKLAALAEPDYSIRQDFPEGQPSIREFLSSDLKKRGADPDVGRKLKDIFSGAGLKVETGLVNDGVAFRENPEIFHQEWELLEKLGYPPNELDALKGDTKARMNMPVCWAIGRKI